MLFYQSKKPLPGGKPHTPAEQNHIRRIDDIPGWLKDHPDLRQEAIIKNRGGRLAYDHPGEAEDLVGMLTKAINHLQLVRGSRSAQAQAAIEAAITRAEHYRDLLDEFIHAK